MRVILPINDLVKAYNRSKIQKDIGKILFPDPKDNSVKIIKILPERYFCKRVTLSVLDNGT